MIVSQREAERTREHCLQFNSKYGKNLEDKLQIKANTRGTKGYKLQTLQKGQFYGIEMEFGKVDRDLKDTGEKKKRCC